MKVNEILALEGPAPITPAPCSAEMLDDIAKLYYDIYVPGLQGFFESSWFSFKSEQPTYRPSALFGSTQLTGLLSTFLTDVSTIQTTASNSPGMAAAARLESRVVWSLACMAYGIPAAVNFPVDEPVAEDDGTEVRNRLAVVDELLSGGCIRTNPCMPPPRSGDPRRIREHHFWWSLAEYLRLQEDANLAGTPISSLTRLREQALSQMRKRLDGRENRDVIYSIAVVREAAPQFPVDQQTGEPVDPVALDPDMTDLRKKLAMALQVLRRTAQDNGGGTNVTRRLAQLALKAFVQPGFNVRHVR